MSVIRDRLLALAADHAYRARCAELMRVAAVEQRDSLHALYYLGVRHGHEDAARNFREAADALSLHSVRDGAR